jgi:signal transduction histidine kinase
MLITCSADFLWAQGDNLLDPELTTYLSSARAYKNQDKTVLAQNELGKAKEWAEENEDTQGAIDTYLMFAELYLDMELEEMAENYFNQSSRLLDNIEYPTGQANNYYIEARLIYSSGNSFMALDALKKAKEANNDRNLLNRITLLEGIIYTGLPNTREEAITRFNALRENTDPYEKDHLKTEAHLALAKLYAEQGENQNAIQNGEEAMKLALTNEFSKEYYQATRLLADLYEQTGQYRLAMQPFKVLLQLRDSLYNADNKLAELESTDEVHYRNLTNQIAKLEEEKEDLSASANRSEITAILTSGFLTIISLLAVSLYRNNQIKLKTNDLLQTKNRELQNARDAAVQAMEAKTNFLSTVSHELRTPLYAVTGLTHLLLEENPKKNQLEHLKSLKFSGDYLLNFINDILQINKIDADKLEPLEMECNLHKVLNEVLNGLQQAAKDQRNELILDYDPQIPSHLMSDPVKLSQVFMNLVGNALKFTREGEVVVIAKLLKREGEFAHIYFEVRDNGIGIDKERQATIFDSFEQGSIQINREYGGTGLGLTIVKSLLGLFGSKINLESEPGKGSAFFFELKMKCKDHLVDDIPFEISPKDYRYEGLHVLVVEDNKINQVITKKMLAKKEITCDIANNGTEAVQLARANEYDGILMDIHMPGISGVEATEEIRKFDSDTPIIALTAISLDDSLEAFYAAGCNDVVTKPFKPELFYEKIGENIVEHKMRKSLS